MSDILSLNKLWMEVLGAQCQNPGSKTINIRTKDDLSTPVYKEPEDRYIYIFNIINLLREYNGLLV